MTSMIPKLPDYGDDQDMVNVLLAIIPMYYEMRELADWKNQAIEDLMKQFQIVNHDKLERLDALKTTVETAWETVQGYIENQASQTGRKVFFGKMVRVQKRRRVVEGFDTEALRRWANEHKVLTLAPQTEDIVNYLMDTNQYDLLIPDEKTALKLALETYDDGTQVYHDHPVGIEDYWTETSQATFFKLMTTLGIEHASLFKGQEGEDSGEAKE